MAHSLPQGMEESSQFFNYPIEDEDDGGHLVFDEPGGGAQPTYQQNFATTLFPDEVSSRMIPFPAKPPQAHPRAQSALPARASAQREVGSFSLAQGAPRQYGNLLAAPKVDGVPNESPGLSSGSSATPETRGSANIITPPNMLAGASQPSKPLDAIFPPPAPLPPPRKRRPRKPRVKNEVTPEEEAAKRNKFLERNRVAATKCRQKKKNWMGDLEETKQELENQNTQLRMEYNALMNEVSQTRALLMAHANCNDINVDKWIENEAKRFVLGAGERYDLMLANFDTAAGPQARHESMSSVSEYTTAAGNDMLSPTSQRASISLPRGMAVPTSPVFFRNQMPEELGARQMPGTTQPPYMLESAGPNGTNVSALDDISLSNDMIQDGWPAHPS
ncbi:uncharacterized protein JN550_011064 [Neoarthrinium moseri]|uniref:uncharacterized protein n=1 Tax=Neoarthrinium moseri TaxID=1658444 RepID=UPI001FDC9951|nr:uncharacterized protein JN550_011064 [Neoarthrinium moseri]KAI1861242.1 hypothetical protein JN550_011064 [Neoarthrinium moseri]